MCQSVAGAVEGMLVRRGSVIEMSRTNCRDYICLFLYSVGMGSMLSAWITITKLKKPAPDLYKV